MSPRSVKFLFAYVSLIGTFLFFQNCGQSFDVQKVEVSSEDNSLGDPNSPPIDQEPPLPSECMSGTTQMGYLIESALHPQLCGNLVIKNCVDGEWDRDDQIYPSCQQLCRHPITNEAAAPGITYTSYSLAQAATQELCTGARIESTCSPSTGLFTPNPGPHAACLVQGQTCAYPTGMGIAAPTGNMQGATVTGYSAQSATYPTLCGNQVSRTCQASGNWSGATPLYTTCEQRCVHPDTDQPLAQNSTYSYYTRQSGTEAECNAARVSATCQATGLFNPLPPQTRYQNCTVTGGTTGLLPRAQLEFVNASGQRQLVDVVDGETEISGQAPFLVQIDASHSRAPTAFAAQSQITDPEAYAFLMLGYRINFGESVGGFWRYPESSSFSRDEETGPPIFSRVYRNPGSYSARLRVRDTIGNESTLRFTVNVTAPATTTHIPATAGSWPSFQSNRRYTLQAGGDYRSFGAIDTGGLHNIVFEKTGSGADPMISSFFPDNRSKFSATQIREFRAAHIRLINIDIGTFMEGQRGFDYVGVIGGLIRQFSGGAQSFFWQEGSEILRSNVRYSRGLFLQDTEARSTTEGSGYIIIGTFRSLHARNTRFVHTENGPTTYAMLRVYGSYFSFRNNLWYSQVDGGSGNGTVISMLAISGRSPTQWRSDDAVGPISSTDNNQVYGYISEKQVLQNNQMYGANSFLTNGVSSVGGGNPSGDRLVYPRLIGWEDNVFFPSGDIARLGQGGELYGQYMFWRNNRKDMGRGSYISASTGAPNRNLGDQTTYSGPNIIENANTRPTPSGF